MSEKLSLNTPLPDCFIDFIVADCFEAKGKEYWAKLIPYKTARTDMEVLDLVVGADRWQNEYRRDTLNILQCGIGIKFGSEWVWKWSNGMPTEIYSDKGEYSDAFKRAGVMWGIGRDLYYMPEVLVRLAEEEVKVIEGKPFVTWKFRPHTWNWMVSIDRQAVIGKEWMHGKWITRVNNQPHKKGIVWNNLWDDFLKEKFDEVTANTIQEGSEQDQ